MPQKSTGRWPSVDVRLAERTDKTETCWMWTGANDGRYGSIYTNGTSKGTHCVAWELASGKPVPEGYVIGHTCDVTLCVRNDEQGTYEVREVLYERWGHLFACTPEANQYDKIDKGRQASGATHGRHTKPGAFTFGDRVHTAKLTAEQVVEARTLYAAKQATQVQLAQRYGVRQCTISSMLRRETWKHLP